MNILAIHDGHNASACHLRDGEIKLALQEERLAREKNYWGTPYKSINHILKSSDMNINDFDSIVFAGREYFGDKISREEFQKRTLNYLNKEKSGLAGTLYGVLYNNYSKTKNRLNRLHTLRVQSFKENFTDIDLNKINYVDHHKCHASAAFYGHVSDNNSDKLVFTADGFGDEVSGTVNIVNSNGIWKEICKIDINDSPHSLAQLYGYVTAAMGFLILEHEYKIMGMAPYGDKERSAPIANEFKKMFPLVNGKWIYKGDKIIGPQLNKILHHKRFDEISCGLQVFFEDTIVEWVKYWINYTGINNIALGGGAFMNVKANMEIMKLPEVNEMFVFPSCSDDTNSIGAAYSEHYRLTGVAPNPLHNFYLGRPIIEKNINSAIYQLNKNNNLNITVETIDNPAELVASHLADGKIVATCWGREEFGARALGNRSILADPRNPKVIPLINNMIKNRDFWMPFACAMLPEDKDKYIKDYGKIDSPYMIMAFEGGPDMENVYAGSHPKDKSVRPQVVKRDFNPLFHDTIKAFKQLTGVGAVLNTSFNLHGHPLVGTPLEAADVFANSGLNILAFENHIITKK